MFSICFGLFFSTGIFPYKEPHVYIRIRNIKIVWEVFLDEWGMETEYCQNSLDIFMAMTKVIDLEILKYYSFPLEDIYFSIKGN